MILKIEGVKARGRQRKMFLGDLVLMAGNLQKGELLHLAQKRQTSGCQRQCLTWYCKKKFSSQVRPVPQHEF